MKGIIQKATFLIFFVGMSCIVWSQETTLIKKSDLIGIKWKVCSDLRFFENYSCGRRYTYYEFFEDGKFTESDGPAFIRERWSPVYGTWKLKGNKLIIKYNDSDKKEKHQMIVDDYGFYSISRYGIFGKKGYTYFR